MRTALIAGNWKMHMLREEGSALTSRIVVGLAAVPSSREVLIIPPYTLLVPLAAALRGTRLQLGAQDLHWEPSGAYTSGISGPMLRDAGCSHVLVGHSERRGHFGDHGVILWKKLRAALDAGLRPIYCMGEDLADREAGRTEAVLGAQFAEALEALSSEQVALLTLAYEPVWAIGTGRTATSKTAQAAHAWLRARVASAYGDAAAGGTRILYGGSVKPENAGELLREPDVDGLLIGGASLKAESFLAIAAAA
jgi:triosephosphate isomerase (TIM)